MSRVNGKRRKCVTCKRSKPVDQYRSRTARRCLDCDRAALQLDATCKACGEPSGARHDGTPRLYCDKPECRHAKFSASTERRRRRLAQRTTRVCSACRERKPLDAIHFSARGYAKDGSLLFDWYCRPCKAADQRLRYRSDPRRQFAAQARAAMQRQRDLERCAVDPEFAARYRERRREQNRASRAKRREREGAEVRQLRPESDRMPRLPAAPLAAVLMRAIERAGGVDSDAMERICGSAGLPSRTLFAWRNGRDDVQFDVADRALIALGLNWWDVWDADDPRALAAFEPEALAA